MLSLLLADAPLVAGGDSLVIIVNRSSNVQKVSESEVRAVFLGRRSTLDGVKVVPIHSKHSSAARIAFTNRILGMTEDMELNYWEQQKIMNGVQSPVAFGDPSRAVFNLKNGVSYTFQSKFNKTTTKAVLKVPLN